MKRLAILGLCLVAALALSSMGASMSSAAWPEFFECKSANGNGRYTERLCLTEDPTSKSNFERTVLAAGTKIKFTTTSGEFRLDAGENTIRCKKSESVGETNGSAAVTKVGLKLKECIGENKGNTCPVRSTAPLGNAEEIVTNALSGSLGRVAATEAASRVGMSLKGATASFSEVEGSCLSPARSEIREGVIGEAGPTEEVKRTATIKYTITAEKKQAIQNFEMAPQEVLRAFGFEAPLEGSSSLTWEGTKEIGISKK